jgi:hypothetical protein
MAGVRFISAARADKTGVGTAERSCDIFKSLSGRCRFHLAGLVDHSGHNGAALKCHNESSSAPASARVICSLAPSRLGSQQRGSRRAPRWTSHVCAGGWGRSRGSWPGSIVRLAGGHADRPPPGKCAQRVSHQGWPCRHPWDCADCGGARDGQLDAPTGELVLGVKVVDSLRQLEAFARGTRHAARATRRVGGSYGVGCVGRRSGRAATRSTPPRYGWTCRR